ncbi:hypothetical protein BDV93DRAFT_608047 [Ceratobasidium sp. AG-I]|nr:hypothetical protein BDV93DRAFT_608047 [Ceratobasidium sp. AG-I]
MSNQSESTVSSTTRHPEYYFPDGSAVLQIGRVLFKVIQSSLLTEESEVFRGMFALPVAQQLPSEHPEQESSTGEGSCDENPILIPEVTPLAFQHFLLMFYGRPTDPEYLLIMADNTTSIKNHDYNRFCRYLDIADLSHRFVAPRLEAWALEQLKAQSTSIKKLSLGWATFGAPSADVRGAILQLPTAKFSAGVA